MMNRDILSCRASEEDKQSFVFLSPGGGDRTSLDLSGDTLLDQMSANDDDNVNEQSISEVLSFNANLTQAAEQSKWGNLDPCLCVLWNW